MGGCDVACALQDLTKHNGVPQYRSNAYVLRSPIFHHRSDSACLVCALVCMCACERVRVERAAAGRLHSEAASARADKPARRTHRSQPPTGPGLEEKE